MIEREAAKIDAEVSEFFFARAQAIRLDARPPSVGTMAAQIRGWEQIRALLSSGSIFLIADLPFAIFFILVIASIGGPIAYVPLVALPIALILALIISRLIRKDTAKAQISGNRKNGLLVEGPRRGRDDQGQSRRVAYARPLEQPDGGSPAARGSGQALVVAGKLDLPDAAADFLRAADRLGRGAGVQRRADRRWR